MSEHVVLTEGERLVGINFNVGGDQSVDECKRRFANAIDQLEMHGKDCYHSGGLTATKEMLIKEAQKRIIDAQMWAVKALTYGK